MIKQSHIENMIKSFFQGKVCTPNGRGLSFNLAFPKLTAIVFFCFVLSSCKKNKDSVDLETLPKFNTCVSVAASGHLQSAGLSGPYNFETKSGGTIKIDLSESILFGLKDYPGFKAEFWGRGTTTLEVISLNYENLNGKHVKNREGSIRTIIFPDGAKITMVADGKTGPLLSITIYDGAECHHINASCGTLEYSSSDQAVTKKLDEQEPDGETGTFEYTSSGLLFVNIYNEGTPGNKILKRVPIGEIDRNKPNQVLDYYSW